jgi:hypothetical protein
MWLFSGHNSLSGTDGTSSPLAVTNDDPFQAVKQKQQRQQKNNEIFVKPVFFLGIWNQSISRGTSKNIFSPNKT